MKISEVFFSVQGEGLSSGKASIFVRTFGCNLNCAFCDTLYAKGTGTSKEMSVSEVIKQIKSYPCKSVCLTGGEPLLQRESLNLIIRLLNEKYEIDVETNGSILFPWWFNSFENLHAIMDWKCPCSGMQKEMRKWNWRMLGRKDAVKFVVEGKKDFKFVERELKKYWFPNLPIFISPIWGKVNLEEVAEYVKSSKFPLQFQLQLHKVIFPDRIKGV